MLGGMYPHRASFHKHHPGDFGRAGMRRYHLKRSQHCCPTVAQDELWTLVSEHTRINTAKNKTELLPSSMCVVGLLQRSGEGKAPWAACPHEGQKKWRCLCPGTFPTCSKCRLFCGISHCYTLLSASWEQPA